MSSAFVPTPGQGQVENQKGRAVAIYTDPNGVVHHFSAVCPHQACDVEWNADEKTWDCPCHGSRFQPTGEVLQGPTESPLMPLDS